MREPRSIVSFCRFYNHIDGHVVYAPVCWGSSRCYLNDARWALWAQLFHFCCLSGDDEHPNASSKQ
jgi:hypothetical protein